MKEYAQWEWDTQTKTYKPGFACHTGNTPVYTDNGTLSIAGWTNLAKITSNTYVIDLTGMEHRFYEMPIAFDDFGRGILSHVEKPCAGWLSLPFPDMKVPTTIKTYQQWEGIANEIQKILQKGVDVLVACQGGHGRSGLFCAIVGYILAKDDPDWENPVEHIRKIHCSLAIETFQQEEYIYKILELDFENSFKALSGLEDCGICRVPSYNANKYGLCLGCSDLYGKQAPKIMYITEDHLNTILPHSCTSGKDCLGIYKAATCGHVVHDVVVYDGLCEQCAWESEQYAKKADEKPVGVCAICGGNTIYAERFGICYDCADDLKKRAAVDLVHNTITDSYSTVAHKCENVICNGIVEADKCGHVVHDQEIEDGLCPECREKK